MTTSILASSLPSLIWLMKFCRVVPLPETSTASLRVIC